MLLALAWSTGLARGEVTGTVTEVGAGVARVQLSSQEANVAAGSTVQFTTTMQGLEISAGSGVVAEVGGGFVRVTDVDPRVTVGMSALLSTAPAAASESPVESAPQRASPEEPSPERIALQHVQAWSEVGAAGKAKAVSRYLRGLRHERDDPAKADYAEAHELFEKSAKSGYAKAQYRLGRMYENGLAVAADLEIALAWYRLAAAQGNLEARMAVARLERPGG